MRRSRGAQWADDVLDPALFGLATDGDPIGPITYVEREIPNEAWQPATTRLELPDELFQVDDVAALAGNRRSE